MLGVGLCVSDENRNRARDEGDEAGVGGPTRACLSDWHPSLCARSLSRRLPLAGAPWLPHAASACHLRRGSTEKCGLHHPHALRPRLQSCMSVCLSQSALSVIAAGVFSCSSRVASPSQSLPLSLCPSHPTFPPAPYVLPAKQSGPS